MSSIRTSASPWSLFFRNRHLLALSILVSLAAGLFAVRELERFEDPRITNLFPIVVTPFPGASAERVESLVTEPLEESLAEIDSIEDLTSTSSPGVSILSIELSKYVTRAEDKEVFSEIRDRLNEAQVHFPEGAGTPVLDDKRDPAAFALLVGVRWEGDGEPALGILDRIAEDLSDRLRAVPGTELVRSYGAPEEELTVEIDVQEASALNWSAGMIAAEIADADSKTPAGVLRGSARSLPIEVRGEIDSIDRVAEIPLRSAGDGRVVRVGDLATVERGWRLPQSEIALVDGSRSVIVAARVGLDRAVDDWSRDALAITEEVRSAVGGGVALDIVFDQARYTNARFLELLGNLSLAVAVVTGVVFLLMGLRAGLVVALALPVVVGLTLYTLLLTGESLHQMSVYGIVIALGLLIDNAIVVTDEVKKEKTAGATPLESVVAACTHLFFPLLASTLTTILAFLPILLLPGGPGDFVGSIGGSVIIAVSWSFVTAMTLTAAMAGIFVPAVGSGDQVSFLRDGFRSDRLSGWFRGMLTRAVKQPTAAVAASLFLPLAGFVLAPTLGNSFFPPADRDTFEVRMWLQPNASITKAMERARSIEELVRRDPEVEHVHWLIGTSFPRVYYNLPMDQDGSPQFAHAMVQTVSDAATKRVLAGLQAEVERAFPDTQIMVKQIRQGPPVIADVEYRISGPEMSELIAIGERMRRALQEDPEVVVAQATMTRGLPKLWFDADEEATRAAGLTTGEVAAQLSQLLEGAVGGSFVEDLEELPVRVRAGKEERESLAELASSTLVRGGGSDWVPLEALGSLRLEPELVQTTRYDGVRTNIVKGFTTIEALPINVAKRVLARLEADGFELPQGYRLELGGTVEQEVETRTDLIAPLPLLLVLMAATLILCLRSTLLAGILGMIALLSVGMAILSTWLIDFPISFNTFMGTSGLIGVALNDSIVVMSEIRANARAAAGEVDGLVEAVMSTTRHVIATTLTTVGGFLPLVVIVGGDFWPSVAIVLAGGIVGSSILALFFIPAMYRLLARWVRPNRGESIETFEVRSGALVPAN